MNVVSLQILLHYHATPAPYPRIEDGVPAISEAVENLRGSGLIEPYPEEYNNVALFRTTEKGRVFVEMLKETPLPVMNWTDPRL